MQVLDVDLSRERISLSLKATQQDPWQEFAGGHEVGELVYGRVTKLVPFGAFVQVGEGIEGLVHISEMAVHHVEAPEQVVTPGEELWVKIIDIDLDRRRISLSIKQAAEGGVGRRRVPGPLRRARLRRAGQLHRPGLRGRRRGGAEGAEAARRGLGEPEAAERPRARGRARRLRSRTRRRPTPTARGRRRARSRRRGRRGVIPRGDAWPRTTSHSSPAGVRPTIPLKSRISSRGVAVSNRRTLMAAAAIVLAAVRGDRGVHVRLERGQSSRRKTRASWMPSSPRATSPRARLGKRRCKPA